MRITLFYQLLLGLLLALSTIENLALGQQKKPTIVFVDPNISIQKWIGKKMPIFRLQDKQGNVYDNKSILGKVTVFNLWSIHCHPCIVEFPMLNGLVGKYSKDNIIFLAPAPESSEQINNAISVDSFNYTVLPDAQSFFDIMGLVGYPYHILVDRNGFIRYIHMGIKNRKSGKEIAITELPQVIEHELNEKEAEQK
ncbi:TlpA family protein disulfide reductase [Spirosoma linguale]|uniref:Alkyl hydroperoxide reductase/ Thiol specific antioxidant/ Mal allergen n=1 Tax=Spirosoma linguale (strain ATCC 33905 / DSM 74 / LMG 10896 / Claus 1) TaxID=504472 RepID=D2QH74_SPILD|nr:alkyl hydroperoxide reductase/ Thiol specific antioxidant/ Mal allergen [Spirosoma linguale DSM 74]